MVIKGGFCYHWGDFDRDGYKVKCERTNIISHLSFLGQTNTRVPFALIHKQSSWAQVFLGVGEDGRLKIPSSRCVGLLWSAQLIRVF